MSENWQIYQPPIAGPEEAKAELAKQVDQTEPVGEHLYLLVDEDGKCPALTGCGPNSKQHAHLVRAAPDMAEALDKLLAIINDSQGVAGFHLNGNVAPWNEFDEEIDDAEQALAKARRGGMSTDTDLKQLTTQARPLIEQQLDIADEIAALREWATERGIEWSQVKALLKAQILDERDESGEGKHVRKVVEKAEYATAYADMLGLASEKVNAPEKVNETISVSETQQNAPEPSNRDLSTGGEPSPEAVSQDEASHAGTGCGTPASHEGYSEAAAGQADEAAASQGAGDPAAETESQAKPEEAASDEVPRAADDAGSRASGGAGTPAPEQATASATFPGGADGHPGEPKSAAESAECGDVFSKPTEPSLQSDKERDHEADARADNGADTQADCPEGRRAESADGQDAAAPGPERLQPESLPEASRPAHGHASDDGREGVQTATEQPEEPEAGQDATDDADRNGGASVDPYERGYAAFQRGVPGNTAGIAKHERGEWLRGWSDAQAERMEVVG